MNLYPQQLEAIVIYLKALDELDKKLDALGAEHLPYMKAIELTDGDGTNYGTLRDEIGGAWSWDTP